MKRMLVNWKLEAGLMN